MRSVLALSLLISICACKREDAPVPLPTAPEPIAAKAIDPSAEVSGLLGKLRYEAAHRPGTGATAERVFAALDGAGVSLARRRQYAGFTMKASYCAGGVAGDVPISVCEYPTPAAAAAGKAYMDGELAARGVRVLRGTTLLNIASTEGEVAKRAIAAFDTL